MPASEEAQKYWKYYTVYRDDTRAWREKRDKLEKFRLGSQWSRDWGEKLEARGQSDIVINKIRALMRMRVSMMIANKPTGNVFGVRKKDVETADLLNNFADWHMYNSDWQYHLEKAVMGQNSIGLHWLNVYPDNMADYGRGELKVGNESYRHVFLDKAAGTTWDFSDASRIINTKQFRPDDWFYSIDPKILKRVGISKNDMKGLLVPDDEIRWSGEGQHREEQDVATPIIVTPTGEAPDIGEWVRELDIYEKRIVNVDVLVDPQGIPIQHLDNDDGPTEVQQKFIDDNKLKIESVPQPRINYKKLISGKLFLPLNSDDFRTTDNLPIENYPFVPVVNEDTGNSMPLGEIDFQAGIQEVFNACVSLTLLNASLASNMKIIVDSSAAGGDATDLNKFKKRWAIPGEVFNMRQNPQTGKFPFEIIRPEPLSQAWFTLMTVLAQEIEFQISTFSLRMGDPTNSPDTFSATLQLGQWAQDILRIPLSRLELSLERIYNIIFQWSPHFYDFEKVFHTFRDDGVALQGTINFLTLPFMKARFRIRAGSTTPSQTVAEVGILQNLAQQQPALVGAVIDRLPGLSSEARKEIKETIDLVQQLSQSNAQKDEVIKVLQTQMQHLTEENFSMAKKDKMRPIEKEADRIFQILKDTRVGLERANNKRTSSKK